MQVFPLRIPAANTIMIDFAGKRIWITGHTGMVGSALARSFANEGAELLLTTRQELDLQDRGPVLDWVKKNQPDLVFHVAAMVGGIRANALMPADFLHSNLSIQTNVIEAAHRTGVKKLLFVASNCIYPEYTRQPISEESLLQGMVESNVRAYAISKIAGIELCRAYNRQYGCNFISVVPPNLYGPGDNYNPETSHVVAGILRRAHEAKIAGKSLEVWGDGTQRREFLHVDDLASGMKCVMRSESSYDLFNIGRGYDLSISEIAKIIAQVVDFKGEILFDRTKPNGTMQKLLDHNRISTLGWHASIREADGLKSSYADFLKRRSSDYVNPRPAA